MPNQRRRRLILFPAIVVLSMLGIAMMQLLGPAPQKLPRPDPLISLSGPRPVELATIETCSQFSLAFVAAGVMPDLGRKPLTVVDYTGDRLQIAACPPEKPELLFSQGDVAPPPQGTASVYPTNYGDRFFKDIHGQRVNHPLLVVLHETVGPPLGTIRYFQTPHYQDSQQVSYHALILADGMIVYLVPPTKRAYGAGNSVFEGPRGPETVQTNPRIAASVNNFAYHISLATPADGDHDGSAHSGYTPAQYQSLAWLITRTGVPRSRIVTHAAVDRSGERQDPRSFDWQQLLKFLHQSGKVSS